MKDVYKQLFRIDNKKITKSETNAFLDSIQKSIAIGSWEVDLQTMAITWSPMTKAIHEVDEDFKPGFEEAINFYVEGHNRDLISFLFEKAVNTGEPFDSELQILTAKNNLKWVRAIGYPETENNTTIKILGVFQDITEKTNTHKELELKEKLIRTTLEHAPNGTALIDLNGKIITLNKSFCNYLGYTKKELFYSKINALSHPDDINIVPRKIKQLIAGKTDRFQCEKRYLKKDGSTIYCILSVSILRDDANNPIHFISHIIDITEKKVAYKKVEKLLETTKNQNIRLKNFAHIVSHNLRSHSGNLEMLLDLMLNDIPEATNNEFFPLIEEAVTNLSETIDNLNEVSSINSNQNQELKNNNLLEFTNKALGNFSAEIRETKAQITIDINNKIEALTVPAYLDSILLNFISNAIKYRKQNISPVINIIAKKTKQYIKLTIEDNGLGINLDLHKDKIFGLYKTFHKHEEARGLGLYITKNQIEAMDGKVEVISEINKGTTFTIYLKYETN